MWILTEDKTKIINTSSPEYFYIADNNNRCAGSYIMFCRSDRKLTTLGTYRTKSLAITALERLFESLKNEENGHAMF